MDRTVPSLSLLDDLVFNVGYVVPMVLQGTFTRDRFWTGFWTRVHPDPAAVRFVHRLRRRYRSNVLALHLGLTKALLVLDPDDVERVLENSPTIYADPKAKRDGMRVFQPNAVTISRGEEWRDRRRFNEAVLGFERPVHAYADRFLRVVREEVAGAPLLESWDDFDPVFARITRRVIFGEAARNDTKLTDLLRRLLREANRPIKPTRSKHYDPFYDRIRGYLNASEPGSLVALCHQVPSSERTRIENQIPHWMFAMWETLGLNAVRALAAILAHPRAAARVREELAAADLTTPDGIAHLTYLEGCLQEAMRLWPTTPMLLRETIAPDVLAGTPIAPGLQILIWNSFNHRDRRAYPEADVFAPEAWAHGRPSVLFNQLSNGPQICAGIDLLLFLGKAVLASVLGNRRYVLSHPTLDPSQPMPDALNVFDVRFERRA